MKESDQKLLSSCVLAVLLTLSAAAYVGGLGFCSDDWPFLYALTTKTEASFFGTLQRLVREDFPTRPGQALILVGLFRLFGSHPLPYHIVNTAVLGITVVLLFIALHRTGVPNVFAFPAAALYALLPQYSTDRFWVAAFQAPASIALYLMALLSGFRVSSARTQSRRILWGILAIAATGASVTCYEVAVPLMLFSILLWWRDSQRLHRPRPIIISISSLVLVIGLSIEKAAFTTRMDYQRGVAGYVYWILHTAVDPFYTREHGGFNLYYAVFTNYWQNGLAILWNARRVAESGAVEHPPYALPISLAAGAMLFWYTRRLADRARDTEWQTAGPTFFTGCLVFLLGYSIFLTNGKVQFSPTGIANRTAIAATIGVAVSFVAAAGIGTRRLRVNWRANVYALAVTITGVSGCYIVNVLGGTWAAAYEQERAVLDAVDAAIGRQKPPGTLLADGVCPYLGPAPVFESSWDFAGAISLRYGTPNLLTGDVLTQRTAVAPKGFRISHYLGETHDYAYGRDLAIANASTGKIYPIPDRPAAERYVTGMGLVKGRNCPPSIPGLGVTIY